MSRFVRASKYRHVFGKPEKPENCYTGITLSRNAWDTNYIAANPVFMAVAWETGGGACAVIPHKNTGKLPQGNIPLVSGHKGAVLDIDWHPFNDYLLGTVSEDGYGRIWSIPAGGLTANLEEPVQVLKGHKRKVGTITFNPVANNLVATSSGDFLVKVWDIESGDDVLTIDGHTDLVQSVAWNGNGSLLATTCKDKNLRLIDPRQRTVTGSVAAHLGVKGSRCTWITNKGFVFTVGFTKTSEREFNMWDPRALDKPIHHTGVDSAAGILMPFYDEDSSMLYLAGKGDGNIRYYEVVDEAPYLHYLSEYKSASPQRGLCFVPKRAVDVSQCEVMRALKVTPTVVEPISFTVPRKSDLFQDDIYPPAYAGKPALQSAEWLNGANAEPVRITLEGGFVAPAAPSGEVSFQKKDVEKELSPEDLKAEVEKLRTRVAYLETELIKRDGKIRELESK